MPKSYIGEIKDYNTSHEMTVTRPLDDRIVVDSIEDLTNDSIPAVYVGMVVNVKSKSSLYVLTSIDESTTRPKDINSWKEIKSIDNYVVETKDDLDNIESPYVGMFVHVKSKPHSMWLYSKSDVDGSFGWEEFKDYTTTLGDVDLSEIQNQINDLKTEIENLKAPNLHVDLHNIDGTDLIRFTYDKSIKKSDTLTYDNTEHKLIFTTPEQETK